MNKVIILSVQPQWLAKILNGEKTIEIRKSMPKCELPIDVYLYCTKGKPFLMVGRNDNKTFLDNGGKDSVYSPPHNYIGNGKIVAKFTLNKVERFDVPYPVWFYEIKEKLQNITDGSRLSLMSLHRYLRNDSGYAWHIDNLQIFDKPMELGEFYKNCKDYHNGWSGCDDVCGYAENNECYGGKIKINKPPQSWGYAYKEE